MLRVSAVLYHITVLIYIHKSLIYFIAFCEVHQILFEQFSLITSITTYSPLQLGCTTMKE